MLRNREQLPAWELLDLDVSWMSLGNQRRFEQELDRLLTLPERDRDAYLQAQESWRGPLGLFSESTENLRDLEVLGLELPCTPEDIKLAFRRQARRVHPDQGGGHEAFIRLQQAYLRALKNCL